MVGTEMARVLYTKIAQIVADALGTSGLSQVRLDATDTKNCGIPQPLRRLPVPI